MKPVHRLIASDADKGANGTVSYSVPQSADRDLWRIDPETGELFMKYLPRPSTSLINLKVGTRLPIVDIGPM